MTNQLRKFWFDSKAAKASNKIEDVEKLQTYIEQLSMWKTKNKRKLLWFGPNIELKNNTILFSDDYESLLEPAVAVKDLGVMVDLNASFEV